MKYKNRRNSLYIGEAFYLDAESKEIIASGYGQFDTIASELTTSMTFLASGKFDKVLIIIKSRNDYIAPFVFYNKTLIRGAPENIAYNIRAYLHWQLTEADSLTMPLRKYSIAHITTLAQHAPSRRSWTLPFTAVYTRQFLPDTPPKLIPAKSVMNRPSSSNRSCDTVSPAKNTLFRLII